MAVPTEADSATALCEAGQWAAARDLYLAQVESGGSASAHLGLARACWWLGETRRAIDHAQQAFAALEAEGRHRDAAMTGVHISVWCLTNFDNPAAARGWLARARHLADTSGDAAVGGWVALVSGYLAADPDEGRRLIEAAARVGASLPDPDLAVMARADLGLWHVDAGEVGVGLGLLDEAMATVFSSSLGMLEVVVWSSCNMLAACSLVDDLERATQWCRAADQFMETYGCPFLQARCRAHYGRVLVAAGRWAEAEAELARALSLSVDTGRGPRTEALTALAELRQRQGRPEAALQLLDGADATPGGAVVRGACLLDLDRTTEAREELRAALAVRDPAAPDVATLVAALVDAELAAGHVHQAATVLPRQGPGRPSPCYPRGRGMLTRARGLVAAAAGDLESARHLLDHARDTFTGLELPFEAGCTELDLGRLLRGVDEEAAVGWTRSAHVRLLRLGARRRADEAAAVLRQLGVAPPPGPRRAQALTVRERDVLGLLPDGLSNPEIARRLFLSPRTVGHHVSSILRKLEVHSRAEAAAYAVREGVDRIPDATPGGRAGDPDRT